MGGLGEGGVTGGGVDGQGGRGQRQSGRERVERAPDLGKEEQGGDVNRLRGGYYERLVFIK